MPPTLVRHCIRGTLPEAEGLSVRAALAAWIESEATLVCETDRADRLLSIIAAANEELAAIAEAARPRRWWRLGR